jgi:hypothetical protein
LCFLSPPLFFFLSRAQQLLILFFSASLFFLSSSLKQQRESGLAPGLGLGKQVDAGAVCGGDWRFAATTPLGSGLHGEASDDDDDDDDWVKSEVMVVL